MPVFPASSNSITIPQPLEPDIELLRQSGNLSTSLFRIPELFPASNCSVCFNESEPRIRAGGDDDDDFIGYGAHQWVGLFSQGLVFYTFPAMVSFGVLGGLMSVLVLARQTNKSSYDVYLLCLVLLGITLLLCGATLRLTDYVGHRNAYQYAYGYARGINEWAWYSSIWTLVMMTLENVLATRFRWHVLPPPLTSDRRQACTVAAVVCAVCFVSSLPHFFEYEVTEAFDYASNRTLALCQLSDEAKTYEYSTVYYWYVVVLTILFPLPLLVSLLLLLLLVWKGRLPRRRTDTPTTTTTTNGGGTVVLKSGLQSPSIGNGILTRKTVTVESVVNRLFVALVVLHLLLTSPLSLLNCVNGVNAVPPHWTLLTREEDDEEFDSVVVYPLCEFCFYCYFVTYLPLLFSYSDRFHDTLLRTFGCRRCVAAVLKPQKTVKFDIQTVEIEIYC